jgi:hypothetical protein
MFFPRSRRGPDRFLRWKIALFAAASVLIYFGIRLERSWVLWGAIGLLLAAVALRVGAGIRGQEPGIRGQGSRAKTQGSGARGQGPGTSERGPGDGDAESGNWGGGGA